MRVVTIRLRSITAERYIINKINGRIPSGSIHGSMFDDYDPESITFDIVHEMLLNDGYEMMQSAVNSEGDVTLLYIAADKDERQVKP